jgi:exopolysaccharide production protein ExoQ
VTVTEVPSLGTSSAQPQAKRVFISKPGVVERSLAILAILFLGVGLPTEWFVVADDIDLSGGGSLVIVVFMALVGSLLLFSLKQFKVIGNLLIADMPLVLLSLVILFSFVWSVDPSTSIRRAIALTLTTLLGIYFVARFSMEEILVMVAMMMIVAIVINWVFVLGLPQYGKNFDGTQYLGATSNRNVLGPQMVLACISMQFLMAKRAWRFIAIVFWLAAAGLVLGTGSKTSFLSLILVNVLWLVFSTFRARRQLFGAVLVSEATASVFGLLFATANLPLVTDILDRDITLTGRTVLWADLMTPIGERFWLGHGWAAFFGGYRSPVHEIWVRNNWEPPTAHNAFLELLLVIGVIGMLLWVLVTVRAMLRSIHYLRERPGAAGMFPIVIISYMVLFSITESGSLRRDLGWMLAVVAIVETKRFMWTHAKGLSGKAVG